ncbi:MAG: hypothetical protein WC516_00830 [Patescibacteria group bacterium]
MATKRVKSIADLFWKETPGGGTLAFHFSRGQTNRTITISLGTRMHDLPPLESEDMPNPWLSRRQQRPILHGNKIVELIVEPDEKKRLYLVWCHELMAWVGFVYYGGSVCGPYKVFGPRDKRLYFGRKLAVAFGMPTASNWLKMHAVVHRPRWIRHQILSELVPW